MRFIAEAYTVAFYRRDTNGDHVEVVRFPATAGMVAACRVATGPAISTARRGQGG